MKKLSKTVSVFLLALFLILSLVGCSARKKRALSLDELMSGGFVYSGTNDRVEYGDLDNFVDESIRLDRQTSIVSGEVISVHYYIEWYNDELMETFKRFFVRTICEVRILDAFDGLNGIGIDQDQVINIVMNYGPVFAKDGEQDAEKINAFFTDHLGYKVEDPSDYEKLESCAFELIPEEGQEYVMIAEGYELLPLEQGEQYAFILFPADSALYKTKGFDSFEALYTPYIVSPFSESKTLEYLSQKYNVYFDRDYLKLADDLKKLFTGD